MCWIILALGRNRVRQTFVTALFLFFIIFIGLEWSPPRSQCFGRVKCRIILSHGRYCIGHPLISILIVIVLIYGVSRRIFPIPWQWGRLAVVVGAAAVLIAGGELLLPTDGAAGFISRLAVFALYPAILWFGGAINRGEREQVRALISEGNLRDRIAAMRRDRATESDEQARAEELYEQEIRDRDRGNF